MDILLFGDGKRPIPVEIPDKLPANGFVWLDFVREDSSDWALAVGRLAGVTIHERHVQDSLNAQHPSFSDSTTHYEMVVFRGLSPTGSTGQFATRPTAFFLFDNLLVTIRPRDSVSIHQVRERLLTEDGRIPTRPVGVMHLVLSAQVDRFLQMREPMTEKLEKWRHDLLDPKNPFDDWMTLMDYSSQLRRMTMVFEEQADAVTMWREGTDVELDDHLMVRINDLLEHIRRVARFTTAHQGDVEALVSLHFSAVAHRTNEIMRVLTVLSAIFLPLTLVAGIFGMNFDNMPELRYQYSYFVVLGAMVTIAIGMLAAFRRNHWF